MSWLLDNAEWIVGAAWSLREAWRAKRDARRRAQAIALELKRIAARLELERAMAKLQAQAEEIPAWAEGVRQKLIEAERQREESGVFVRMED